MGKEQKYVIGSESYGINKFDNLVSYKNLFC